MSHLVSKACASGALSVMVLAAGGATTAWADPGSTPESCSAEAANRDEARAGLLDARKAFTSIHGPMNKVMAAERREARAELRAALRQLKSLRKSAEKAAVKSEDHAELRAQIKQARAEAKKALRLLGSQRALTAEIRAERATAKKAFEAAQVALREAKKAYEDCAAAAQESSRVD